ncbi:hypothetical protein T03_12435 [Trichinella britovi]|uniref:Uncharacterized protein n=1 Tax=Trichinella britovi TaxID=45882 RepID=A0A0V1DCB6_TRIBR|nr:hypothetical protein T03_12435 [Trichinella britovi]
MAPRPNTFRQTDWTPWRCFDQSVKHQQGGEEEWERWKMRAPRSTEKLPTTNSDENTPAQPFRPTTGCWPGSVATAGKSTNHKYTSMHIHMHTQHCVTNSSHGADWHRHVDRKRPKQQPSELDVSVCPHRRTFDCVRVCVSKQAACVKMDALEDGGVATDGRTFCSAPGHLNQQQRRLFSSTDDSSWCVATDLEEAGQSPPHARTGPNGTGTARSCPITAPSNQFIDSQSALKLARGRRSLPVIYRLINNNNNNNNNSNNNSNNMTVEIVEMSRMDNGRIRPDKQVNNNNNNNNTYDVGLCLLAWSLNIKLEGDKVEAS